MVDKSAGETALKVVECLLISQNPDCLRSHVAQKKTTWIQKNTAPQGWLKQTGETKLFHCIGKHLADQLYEGTHLGKARLTELRRIRFIFTRMDQMIEVVSR